MKTRLVMLACLAIIAVTAVGVPLSGASFTSSTTTTVRASASPVSADTLQSYAGNGQTAVAGSTVATAPAVRVLDKNGNPVSGVGITFAVASGGGSATSVNATTNASGVASVGSWKLGNTAGANTLTATGAGLASPVTFTATGTAGAATHYNLTSSRYAPVAGSVVIVSAQLVDQYDNPVASSGRAVTWSKTGAGGSFAANPTTTSASGLATCSLTTTTGAGVTYTVTATSAGPLTGTSPSIVTVAGAASKIVLNAGNSQTATVGMSVAVLPSVKVTDANNNPVSGVSVTFAVASGGGTATVPAAVTDASGIATVGGWSLGTKAGANTLTATSAGLTGSPVTFTATGVAGAATHYNVTASPLNPARGTVVAITAQMVDQYDNSVARSGVVVTWSKTGTGGSFASGTSSTNASGLASVNFTTANAAGRAYTVKGTSTGPLTGTSPTFTTQ